jgi:hypothetical protein
MWTWYNSFIGRIKNNFSFIINKYVLSVKRHFSSLKLFQKLYWQSLHCFITWLQICPIMSRNISLFNEYCLYLMHSDFSTFFQTHPLQPLFVSSAYSFIITALCSSCVATVFAQIMQRIWQREVCPCPPHEGICGSGGQTPQDGVKQLYDSSALSSEKAPPTSIKQETGWASEQFWTFRRNSSSSTTEYLIFQHKIFTKIPSTVIENYMRSDGQRSTWQRTQLEQIN